MCVYIICIIDADTFHAIKEDNQGKRLSNVHIKAAQKVLSYQFPIMVGFQNTLRSQNLNFNRIAGPYIQISHINRNQVSMVLWLGYMTACTNLFLKVHCR